MYATRFDKWSNELLRKGELKGEQRGLQKGRQEGLAELLLLQLTSRFGPQADALSERVRTASTAQLEQWAKSILDARTLDEVFRIH